MLTFCGMTDIGLKRDTNQDSYYAGYIDDDTLLCVVCDGMGGANGGAFASKLAVSHFVQSIKDGKRGNTAEIALLIDKSVKEANRRVLDMANSDTELSGMGTTLVCALFFKGKIYCASVGDSRIYVHANSHLSQLSHDHSYVQTLVDSGQITIEQAKVHPNRNIITKAVGISEEISADIFVLDEENTDGILLCSDGLSGYVDGKELQAVANTNKSPDEQVKLYIQMALDAGGTDNITAVYVKI